MKHLAAADVLNIWEQGLNASLLQRAMIMLACAFPDLPPDQLAELSIGKRDDYLLLLRERLFGPRLVNTALCPNCSELMEWENQVSDMRSPPPAESKAGQVHTLILDRYQLNFRLPNSADLASLEGFEASDSAVDFLLKRCVTDAKVGGKVCVVEKLPKKVVVALGKRIEALDPQAEIQINLNCPNCQHKWPVFFDVASFLWTEINDWAERMLLAIHTLAQAYSWTETEILRLSPVRRQFYLGFVHS